MVCDSGTGASGAAKELSIVLPEGASSEGQAYQNLYNDAAATVTEDNPGGNEQAYQMTMNTSEGTITLSRVQSEGTTVEGFPKSGPGHVLLNSPEEIRAKFGANAATFGDVHTHQAENYSSVQESMNRNSKGPDGTNARKLNKTTFSIGSMGSTIQHNRTGSTIVSPNNQVFEGNPSLIKTALQATHRN